MLGLGFMELTIVLIAVSVSALISIVILSRKLGSANAKLEKVELDVSLYRDFLEKTNETLPDNYDDIRKLFLER